MKQHKCIITGIGRSGTTFLVQLLTKLGLDTGFADQARYDGYYVADANAGLEINILKQDPSPYIVKDPRLCDYLPKVIDSGRFVIDHALIPIRELEAATLSRVSMGKKGEYGGLWKTSHPTVQRPILAEAFYQLMFFLTLYDIPHTMLLFPRLVEDPGYTYRKLQFLLGGIDEAEFTRIFNEVAKPTLVHTFDEEKRELQKSSGWIHRGIRKFRQLLRF